MSYLFLWIQETEHLRNILAMVYLYFYFSGLSLRKTSERLSSCFIKREKSCINQSGIGYKQKYKPKKIFERKKKENRGIHHWWNINKNWFRINWYGFGLLLSNLRVRKSLELVGISKERNMLLAERFISSLVGIHGHQHPSSFHRWMEVLGIHSTSLQVFEVASSYPFPLWEEHHYRKNNAVHDKR